MPWARLASRFRWNGCPRETWAWWAGGLRLGAEGEGGGLPESACRNKRCRADWAAVGEQDPQREMRVCRCVVCGRACVQRCQGPGPSGVWPGWLAPLSDVCGRLLPAPQPQYAARLPGCGGVISLSLLSVPAPFLVYGQPSFQCRGGGGFTCYACW